MPVELVTQLLRMETLRLGIARMWNNLLERGASPMFGTLTAKVDIG